MLEDDPQLCELVSSYLALHFIIDTTSTFDEACEFIDQIDYDIVLLDRNIHGKDIGMELIALIKKRNPQTGVILISAYDTTADKVKGLNLGADDYLEKPFDNEELLARITALSRRNKPMIIELKDLQINLQSKTITSHDNTISLSKKESDLFFYLLQHRGEILSKERLLNALYLHPEEISSNTIDATIKNIRKKLSSEIINTVKTRGYVVP
jgi:DNA-binding response OmpR family regulator